MVAMVKRYVCDACKKVDCVGENAEAEGWVLGTEVGDLCPSCSRAWGNFKQSFLEKMRIDNGKDIYDYTNNTILVYD